MGSVFMLYTNFCIFLKRDNEIKFGPTEIKLKELWIECMKRRWDSWVSINRPQAELPRNWGLIPSRVTRWPVTVNGRFGRRCRLYFQGWRMKWARKQRESRWQAEPNLLANWFIFSIVKMEARFSSEASVDCQRITRFSVSEDRTVQMYWK
jgi:hypothetical protein